MSKGIIKNVMEGKGGLKNVVNRGKTPVTTQNSQGPPPKGGSGAKPKPTVTKAV